jgi:hypothetical protein
MPNLYIPSTCINPIAPGTHEYQDTTGAVVQLQSSSGQNPDKILVFQQTEKQIGMQLLILTSCRAAYYQGKKLFH